MLIFLLGSVRAAVMRSIQFTHYTPRMAPNNLAETLQVFPMELKITEDNAGGFEFPLFVYGVVAALDSRQNILFSLIC